MLMLSNADDISKSDILRWLIEEGEGEGGDQK